MTVSFDPHLRLQHLENYVLKIHLNLPLDEARIQLLRCRAVGYSLAAELKNEGYSRKSIDALMAEAYRNLRNAHGCDVVDPFIDPCASQYMILDELRSYAEKEMTRHFRDFLLTKFKKAFIPTLCLLTEFCRSGRKYSWEEVKTELQEIMMLLEVPVSWDECDAHLSRYMEKVAPILED